MPSAAEIKAGAAYVELYLRDNRFVRGLRAANRQLTAFGATVRGIGLRIGAVGASALMGFVPAIRAALPSASDRPRCWRMRKG